jgi:1H-pyrrole-2-carbonyl-[peptidyl-carrier protein] chlorinase
MLSHRPHVGESMVLSSTRVFEEIGFLSVMEREGFVHKYGAAWHAPGGKSFSHEFSEFPQEGIRQDYTYHVDRSKFDLLLLKHAESLGSKIYQGIFVKQVLFDEDGPRKWGESYAGWQRNGSPFQNCCRCQRA